MYCNKSYVLTLQFWIKIDLCCILWFSWFFPVGFVSRWFTCLGGVTTSLKLGNPVVSRKSPIVLSYFLTQARYSWPWQCVRVYGSHRLWELFSWGGKGEESYPHFSSPAPVAQVLLGKHILLPFTKEDAETQKDYGLPVPWTHLLTSAKYKLWK